jgi:AcrR family transcriptional regulator
MASVARPTQLRERKKQEVRARLVEEARRLFASQGLWSTTIEQIAAAADVAPATFFNYFPNKAALLKEMAGAMFASFATLLREQRGRQLATHDRFASFFSRAGDVIEQTRHGMPALLRTALRAVVATDEGREDMDRLRRSVSALVYDGQGRGDVRADIDAAFLAEMIVGAFVSALISWLDDPRFPLSVRMSQMAAFVRRALDPAPDPKRGEER